VLRIDTQHVLLHAEGESDSRVNFRHTISGKCGEDGANLGFGDGLDVVEIGGARSRHTVIFRAKKNLCGDVPNGRGDWSDGNAR